MHVSRAARSAIVSASLVATFAPARARADEGPSDTGVALSVHLGYALLAGHFARDTGLDPLRSGTLVGGTLGWRFARAFELSAWGEYAGGVAKMNASQCASGACTAHDGQIGAEVAWHLLPGARVDPWVAAGFGYEWAIVSYPGLATSDPALASVAYPAGSYLVTSPVLVRLEAGADVKLDSGFAIGPWLAGSLGRANHADAGDTSDAPVHVWFALGVRGAFEP